MEPGRSRAPYCRTEAGTLSSSRPRGQGAVVHTGSSAVKGGDGRGLETFDDQPDAQRKLPESDRECGYQRRCGRSADEIEQNGEVCCDEHGRSDESEQRKNSRHQPRSVQQGAQQQAVHRRYEDPRDEEYPVIHGDQRMAGDQRLCAGAENVVRTSHRTVESEGRDRDKREQVEHTCGKRGLSVWTHHALIGGRRSRGDHDVTLLLFVGVIGTMTVWEVRLMTSEPCSASRNG